MMKTTLSRALWLNCLLLLLAGVFPAQAFYNPTKGRWLSRDPIAEEGGINLNGFIENDPVAAFDPFGMVKFVLNRKKVTTRLTIDGINVCGETSEPFLKSETPAKLKFDKKTCVCVVKRKPTMTFQVDMKVVKAGKQSWTENAYNAEDHTTHRNSNVYVSSGLAKAALAHEMRRYEAYRIAYTSYYAREYEDRAATLTASTCDELQRDIDQLRSDAKAKFYTSAEAEQLAWAQIAIYLENIVTKRWVRDTTWRGVHVYYDIDE
jgi:hypothetical protein